jgi:hypothetical protein
MRCCVHVACSSSLTPRCTPSIAHCPQQGCPPPGRAYNQGSHAFASIHAANNPAHVLHCSPAAHVHSIIHHPSSIARCPAAGEEPLHKGRRAGGDVHQAQDASVSACSIMSTLQQLHASVCGLMLHVPAVLLLGALCPVLCPVLCTWLCLCCCSLGTCTLERMCCCRCSARQLPHHVEFSSI